MTTQTVAPLSPATGTEPHVRRWTKEEYYRLGELGLLDGQRVELIDGEIIVQYPEPGPTGLPYRGPEPEPRLWTKEEYYRLGELGFFCAEKAELLEGVIMVTSPQKWSQYSSLDRGADVLRHAFGASVWVRQQAPLDLGLIIEPEPDLSVVSGSREDYSAHPTTALLIVEVSETTLAFDQTQKASLYARAGISDYWIINLVQDQVEVYRDPVADQAQPYGFRYSQVRVYFRNMSISPLANPAVSIAVTSLLG